MDIFKDQASTLIAPIRDGQLVVTNNTTPLPATTRAIYIGQPGHVAVTLAGGQTLTFANLPAGTLLPIRVTHVLTTGTTSTNILALW